MYFAAFCQHRINHVMMMMMMYQSKVDENFHNIYIILMRNILLRNVDLFNILLLTQMSKSQ